MNSLESAIEIALNAHEGQTDKAGETYIQHPLRLMNNVGSTEEKIVAVLHDVVEDSSKEFEDLTNQFSDEIIEALKCMTKKDEETYQEFIQRAKENEIAREVKKADIKDNMNINRLNKVDDEDLKRLKKYHRSLQQLES